MHAVIVRSIAVILFAIPSWGIADDWTPPENPDPQTILDEASIDARAMRYETALAKHVWFHENALRLNQAMVGVRLSFALSAWKELGSEYPPALEKLKSIRDALEERVKKGDDIGVGFHDLAAINRTLDEDPRTADSFRQLDSHNAKAAAIAFNYAKAALVKDKAYELYVKYVDPKRDFLQMKRMYELNKRMAEDPKFGSDLLKYGEKSFRNSTATLVAILAINKRNLEAAEIATLAKKEIEDAKFHQELEAALAGTVPTPWP